MMYISMYLRKKTFNLRIEHRKSERQAGVGDWRQGHRYDIYHRVTLSQEISGSVPVQSQSSRSKNLPRQL